jgi:phage terminase large subunit-like protein
MSRGQIRTRSDEAALEEGCYIDAAKADAAMAWMDRHLGVTFYEWQSDLLWDYFAWRRPDGGYRFRTVSVWIPKKNGKTFVIAPLVDYKSFELRDAHIYSVAYNAKQAGIVCDTAIKLLKKSPTLGKQVRAKKIKCFFSPYRREIDNKITGTVYEALADNIQGNDGLIGKMLVVDELHRMKNALYDVVKGCIKNIPGALEVIISTAGSGDKTQRAWEKYSYAKDVLEGRVIDTSILVVIYENLEPLKDPNQLYSLEAVLKANPTIAEDAEKRAEVERDLIEARRLRNDNWWRRFILNQWVSADGEAYVQADEYAACQVEPVEAEQLASASCYVGIDRGGTWDLSGVTILYEADDGRIYEEQYSFAGEDRLPFMAEKDDVDYTPYVERGELIVYPADAVVDEWLANWLKDKLSGLNVQKVGADPNKAAYICETLTAAGYDVVHVQQNNNRLLSPVIEDYMERVRQRRLIHPANSLYDWQLSCANRMTTAKDSVKIVKKGSNYLGKGGSGHIDNVDSGINALAVLRAEEIKRAANTGCGVVTA